jgi:hypothetical protein
MKICFLKPQNPVYAKISLSPAQKTQVINHRQMYDFIEKYGTLFTNKQKTSISIPIFLSEVIHLLQDMNFNLSNKAFQSNKGE